MSHSYSSLRDLFDRCVDLAEGERLAWIEQHVPDPDQRIELELMLAADRRETGFLARDVASHIGNLGTAQASEFEPEDLVGRRFGAFELIRLLGQGGQGTVYLAERHEPDFHQTAAVKLLRRGIHDPIEHRRFRRERDVLARFDHPGVARLIDGGVSPEGVPYLVMEYVDGVALDQWCRARELDATARLRLFSQLCRVVAMAHRALIVHRDLKPSNVLVTGDGTIKVLDFGIARLLDEDESNTENQFRLLTPGYGAPEQATGGTITPATDVFALGVVLRVLLTGARPSDDPSATGRAGPAALPLDLRLIIDKACAAEAELRYRDATELDDDVQRYLEARPVRAHPPSRWYRARRFAERHRGGIAVTVLFVTGILASLAVALWQGQVAREQAQRAEAARAFLLGVFNAAKDELPRDARPTPDVLVRMAAKRLDGDGSLAPPLRAELLGDLASISYSSSDYAQALQHADRALAVLDGSGDRGSRARLAIEIRRANALVSLGRGADADRALAARIDRLRAVDDEVAVDGLSAFASARLAAGRTDDAVVLARDAAQLAERVYGRDSQDALIAASMYGDLLSTAGRHQEAAAVLEAAIAQRRAAHAPPDRHLADSLTNLAAAKYAMGDHAGSERLLREALELSRRIYQPPHEKLADILSSLSPPLIDQGKFDEAGRVLDEAEAMYRALFPPLHPNIAWMLDAQGTLRSRQMQYAEAQPFLERATAICTEARLDSDPACARYWQNLSHVYLKLGRLQQAEDANLESLAIRRRLYGEKHPAYAGSLAGRAAVLISRGRADEALRTIDEALAIFVASGQDRSLGAATMLQTRARTLVVLGRDGEAMAELERADALRTRLAPGDQGLQLGALAIRVEALDHLGRADEARAAARSALALASSRAVLAPDRWQRIEALAR